MKAVKGRKSIKKGGEEMHESDEEGECGGYWVD